MAPVRQISLFFLFGTTTLVASSWVRDNTPLPLLRPYAYSRWDEENTAFLLLRPAPRNLFVETEKTTALTYCGTVFPLFQRMGEYRRLGDGAADEDLNSTGWKKNIKRLRTLGMLSIHCGFAACVDIVVFVCPAP